ncbi:hypothetical protein DRO47_06065 [Candidatus Bathyarchaeota archaeon]|nr:MAG: hypothetical protein DRO47_06065 [Candidatus Bathyarchaeota archaeon]
MLKEQDRRGGVSSYRWRLTDKVEKRGSLLGFAWYGCWPPRASSILIWQVVTLIVALAAYRPDYAGVESIPIVTGSTDTPRWQRHKKLQGLLELCIGAAWPPQHTLTKTSANSRACLEQRVMKRSSPASEMFTKNSEST